ncbi:MAG: FxLYD domain-containing protein [Anaerolineae bacterium]|nr:FxLYD domain-containing protein [Anaerolineae bacterium]
MTHTPTSGLTATPTPTSTPTPVIGTPTPSPTPTTPPVLGDVIVRSHRSYRVGNALVVVGEVLNRGTADVYSVTLSAAFYDADGRLIATQVGATLLPWTGPGQTNPFRLEMANAPGTIKRYELSLRWDDVSVLDFVRLTLVSQEVRRIERVVAGQVRNDHPFPVTGIQIAATFYDIRGNVLEAIRGIVETETIAPGATANYTIQVAEPELPFERLEVQVQGYRAFRED